MLVLDEPVDSFLRGILPCGFLVRESHIGAELNWCFGDRDLEGVAIENEMVDDLFRVFKTADDGVGISIL